MTAPGTHFLAGGRWLNGDRALAWCRVLALAEIAWLCVLAIRAAFSPHPATELITPDFACFWSAAVLATTGAAQRAYDAVPIGALEHSVLAIAANQGCLFMYPPTFLLLCLPLAMMNFAVAAAAFVAAGLAAFVLGMRRLMPQGFGWLPLLAFPGVFVTAGTEQNGFYSAACFGGGALLLERRPFLAGACLGLLTCKPQLSILVPLGLAAARRWQALAGAACSAIGLAALSALVLGPGVWARFPQASREGLAVLTGGLIDPGKLQSVFEAALMFHASHLQAGAAQALASLAAAAMLVWVARHRPGGRAEIAVMAACTLVATPYLMDYDLVVAGVPLAWLASKAMADGWRPAEKYAALAAYMMPLLTDGLAKRYGVPLAPVILVALLMVVAYRAAREATATPPYLAQPSLG